MLESGVSRRLCPAPLGHCSLRSLRVPWLVLGCPALSVSVLGPCPSLAAHGAHDTPGLTYHPTLSGVLCLSLWGPGPWATFPPAAGLSCPPQMTASTHILA